MFRSLSNFKALLLEIDKAVVFLHLPTFSRSHHHCLNPKSEISCKFILKSYHFLSKYENKTCKHGFSKYVFIKGTNDGLGNKFMAQVVGFLFALYTKRKFVYGSKLSIKSGKFVDGSIWNHPQTMIYQTKYISNFYKLSKYKISLSSDNIKCFELFSLKYLSEDILKINMNFFFSSIIYSNLELSKLIQVNFGFHMHYILSNYLNRFKNEHLKQSLKCYNYIPRDAIVYGLHLRFHKEHFKYVETINKTLNQLFNFLDFCLKNNNTYLSIGSDSLHIINLLENRYPEKIIIQNVTRGSDNVSISAILDLIMLCGANYFIGTRSSTFSFLVQTRINLRSFMYSKNGIKIYSLFYAEALYPSPQYFDKKEKETMNESFKLCKRKNKKELDKKVIIYLGI
jgi:hypothetical protein